jgi:NAD(P)-dependent dehydrogenase (short-subunit alcohol dehydrogenase family)
VTRGQVILITGSSSGIGRATVSHAAARGHRVFATARMPDDLASRSRPGAIDVLGLDVTDSGSIERAVAEVVRRAGRLDALVNNAGYGQYGSVEDVSLPDWRRQYEVNVFGALAAIQAALPALRKSGGGTIVNVSSVAGKIAIPFAAPYCSSKHALEAISDSLRLEVAPFGIRVVVVEPGPIATRFGDRARAEVKPFLEKPGPYKSFYAEAERAMDEDFRRGQLPPEAVARVIVKSIEARRPKTRYRVTLLAKLGIPARSFLPDRVIDRAMSGRLKLPRLPKRNT